MDESRHLQVDYRADDGTVVIALAGELDIASAPELEKAIDRATASGARLVIVDLHGLEFMDSTGNQPPREGTPSSARVPASLRGDQRTSANRPPADPHGAQ